MTTIYRELSAEQQAHFLAMKQRLVDKTELLNKTTDECIWVLSDDANDSLCSVYIESIVFFNASHNDNNAIFFLKDPSVPGGISYLTKPREQACASIFGLLENLRIRYNGMLTTVPDLYVKAIKKYYTKEPVIDLKKEFDDFKTDTPSLSIEKCDDTDRTEMTGPIYRHPCCSEGFDTYLTVTTGYGNTPPKDVLIGTWCVVREVYPDGTIITADGDRLAPAVKAYADTFKNEGTFDRQNLVYYVLAINSNRPSQQGFSSTRQNAPYGYHPHNNMFNQSNPYYDTIQRVQQHVSPCNSKTK